MLKVDIQIQADGKQAVLRWVPQGGIEVSLQYAASEEAITLPFSSTLTCTKKNIPDTSDNPFRYYIFPASFTRESSLQNFFICLLPVVTLMTAVSLLSAIER